jgi:hypothetical protein
LGCGTLVLNVACPFWGAGLGEEIKRQGVKYAHQFSFKEVSWKLPYPKQLVRNLLYGTAICKEAGGVAFLSSSHILKEVYY